MNNQLLNYSSLSNIPRRNWVTFCMLLETNPALFNRIWQRLGIDGRAEARESVRLEWCRSFEHRPLFGAFLRITEL